MGLFVIQRGQTAPTAASISIFIFGEAWEIMREMLLVVRSFR